MPGDNTMGYTQPHTIIILCGREGIENLGFARIWNASTGVGNREHHLVILQLKQLLREQMTPGFHEVIDAKIDETTALLPDLFIPALTDEPYGSAHFEVSITRRVTYQVRFDQIGVLLADTRLKR